MKVQVFQALHLGGKDYAKGVHALDEKAIADVNFEKYAKLGWIGVANEVKAKPTVDQKQRGEALLKKRAAAEAKAEAKAEEKAEEKAEDAANEQETSVEEKAKAKLKQHKHK